MAVDEENFFKMKQVKHQRDVIDFPRGVVNFASPTGGNFFGSILNFYRGTALEKEGEVGTTIFRSIRWKGV